MYESYARTCDVCDATDVAATAVCFVCCHLHTAAVNNNNVVNELKGSKLEREFSSNIFTIIISHTYVLFMVFGHSFFNNLRCLPPSKKSELYDTSLLYCCAGNTDYGN